MAHTKKLYIYIYISSVAQTCPTLWPHEPQHARPPYPSPTPEVPPNPCPLSRWCHPTISSSVVPFSSCPQTIFEKIKSRTLIIAITMPYYHLFVSILCLLLVCEQWLCLTLLWDTRTWYIVSGMCVEWVIQKLKTHHSFPASASNVKEPKDPTFPHLFNPLP